VRLYTTGLPAELRERRRAEIDADLWAHQQEGRTSGVLRAPTSVEILLRTLGGVFDDLGWRRDALRAWRDAAADARGTTMTLSTRQLRWMGLGALIGGP
jgi:hypothetical protein